MVELWTYSLNELHNWWWMPLVWVVSFLAGLGIMRWLVLHIPSDYFVRIPKDWRYASSRTLLPHLALVALKNGSGILLLAVGLAMLVTPGPGLLAMILGLSLVTFPGKRRLQERLLGQPRVLRAANRLRVRNGVLPLALPPQQRAA